MIPPAEVELRRMIAADIPTVFRIDRESSALYWPESSYHFETEQNRASRPWTALSQQGEIMGFLILWLIEDELHVANFAVAPAFRRRGIGWLLMDNGLNQGWDEGARRSFLEVRAGNEPAIALYSKIGYTEVNRRKSYYQDNQEDALLMNLEEPAFHNYILAREK